MRTFYIIFLTATLFGCKAEQKIGTEKIIGSKAVITSCPQFPETFAIRVSGTQGSDYWLCDFSSITTKEHLFFMYLGNGTYNNPVDLSYYGVTTSITGNLVWFSDKSGKHLSSYNPTKDGYMPYAAVWFTPKDLADFKTKAELVSQLQAANPTVF